MTIGAAFERTVNGDRDLRRAATPALANLPLATFVLCLLAASALALLQPGTSDISGPVSVSSPALARSGQDPALLEGSRPDWRRVRPGNGIVWLFGTWRGNLRSGNGEPIALRMSGPFSGELYWNGRLIGRKGRSSADPAGEIPGPIDSSILIPDRLIQDGKNRWALRISSHHAGYETASAIHALDIGIYRGSGRGLSYYLPALLLFGGIAACAAVAFSRFAGGGEARFAATAMSAAMLAGAMGAEVSRAVVNYTYDWHFYRQVGTLLLLTGHVGFLLPALFPSGPKPSLVKSGVAIVAVAGVALAILLVSGFDQKIGWMLGLSYGAIFILSVLRRHTSRAAIHAGMMAAAGLVFLMAELTDFLNVGVYAFGLALLSVAVTARQAPAMLAAKPTSGSSDPHSLLVAHAGDERLVQWSQVCTLRAFGNTTEVTLRCGTSLTNNCGLGQLLRTAPEGLVRIHKSFAVNLAFAAGVQTIRRGSYRLLLQNGRSVPLSRTKRNRVRTALKNSECQVREDA